MLPSFNSVQLRSWVENHFLTLAANTACMEQDIGNDIACQDVAVVVRTDSKHGFGFGLMDMEFLLDNIVEVVNEQTECADAD